MAESCDRGHNGVVDSYAVGYARPDRWSRSRPEDTVSSSWHAVEAHRPPAELDGEVELAVCGAIVQVWGAHRWDRVGARETACAECKRSTTQQLSRAG